jgi:hypothetical protein
VSISVDDLRAAVESGAVHTVRVSFSDRLGNWRGKRVPAKVFLASSVGPDAAPMGFCDGMLVADVMCEVIQETPFSNYDTGYPDFHLYIGDSAIRPVGWSPGEVFVFGSAQSSHHESLGVHPTNVLKAVEERAAGMGAAVSIKATLSGRLMNAPDQSVRIDEWPDGSSWGVLGQAIDGLVASGVEVETVATGAETGFFSLTLGSGTPSNVAQDLVVAKNGIKEVISLAGITATFMTIPLRGIRPATLQLDLVLEGPVTPHADDVFRRLDAARPLLQPSVNAYKAGRHQSISVRTGERTTSIGGLTASAEADPFTAIAVCIAACLATEDPRAASTDWIVADARELAAETWLLDWLGNDLVYNAIPLAVQEGLLLAGSVTDLEVNRYWALG